MLLATRALGLGTTLTTRHTGYGKEVDAIFGLPSGVHSYAILPIGWPMGRFGPLGRGPLKDVVFQDQWGKPYPGVYLGAVERIVTEKGLPSDRRRFARLRVRRSSPLSPAVSTLKFERTAIFWDSSVFR